MTLTNWWKCDPALVGGDGAGAQGEERTASAGHTGDMLLRCFLNSHLGCFLYVFFTRYPGDCYLIVWPHCFTSRKMPPTFILSHTQICLNILAAKNGSVFARKKTQTILANATHSIHGLDFLSSELWYNAEERHYWTPRVVSCHCKFIWLNLIHDSWLDLVGLNNRSRQNISGFQMS